MLVSDPKPEVVISEDGAELASSLLPLLEKSSVFPSPLPQDLVKQVYEADLEACRSRQRNEEWLRDEEKWWLAEEARQQAEEIWLWTERMQLHAEEEFQQACWEAYKAQALAFSLFTKI